MGATRDREPSPFRPAGGLAVFAVAVLVFLPSALGAGFVELDDRRIILEQPFLRAITAENVWRCFWPWPLREEWLPLRDLSLLLTYAVAGEGPRGFAVGNVLLHGLASVAVLGLARRALASRRDGETVAVLAALVFAVHPIHVESVAWLSGRKDVLSGALFAFALSRYLDAVTGEPEQRLARLAVAWLLGLAAHLSKSTTACLPLVALAGDLLLGRPRPLPARLASVAPFFLLAAAFVPFYGHLVRSWGGENQPVIKSTPELSVVLFTNAAVLPLYLLRLACPWAGQRLFAEELPRASLSAETALGLAVVASVLGGAAWLARRAPREAFGAALFLLAFTPILNFVGAGIWYAERYLYLPSIGFAIVAAQGLAALARARPRALRPLVAVLACALALATFRLASVFRSDEALWTHILEREPRNTIALSSLAGAVFDRDPARAEALYRETLAVNPERWKARKNLAVLLERRGALDEALAELKRAARPTDPDAFLGAARLSLKRKDAQGALALYEHVAARWSLPAAFYGRAQALDALERSDDARAAYRLYLDRFGELPGEASFAEAARARLAR